MRSRLPTYARLAMLTFLLIGAAGSIAAAAEPAIPGVGPTGPVVKVRGEFAFTEGPAFDDAGNLYFTDIPNGRIWKVDPQGEFSIFREPSNTTNGLMFVGGLLYGCEMEGRIVAMGSDGSVSRVVAGTYNGNRFNAPNDLVVDKQGGVYFTDPTFRAPMPLPQGVAAVYYATAAGEIRRLIDDLPNPNGVILSPDEQTLYVIPSGQDAMMAYPVTEPGVLGEGRVFCRLKQPEGVENTGGDGLTIDTEGRLYITSGLGLQVFAADGTALGIIEIPEKPANVAFGGSERKMLYVTARTSLYAVPTEATGHVFMGAGR